MKWRPRIIHVQSPLTNAVGSEPAQRRGGLTHCGPSFSLDDICVSWNRFVIICQSLEHVSRMMFLWMDNFVKSILRRDTSSLCKAFRFFKSFGREDAHMLQKNYSQTNSFMANPAHEGMCSEANECVQAAVGVSTSCSLFYLCMPTESLAELAGSGLPVIH